MQKKIQLETYIREIQPLSPEAMEKARKRTDGLMKPLGSLGKLEELAIQIAGITGQVKNTFPGRCTIVMAADNGICREGVASAPWEITRIQTENMAKGMTAISVLSRSEGAHVCVVDAGIHGDCENGQAVSIEETASLTGAMQQGRVIVRKVRRGTDSFLQGPAMTQEEAVRTILMGIEITEALIQEGYTLFGTGEMGIGNTSTAAAVISAFTGISPGRITGRGAGLTEEAYRHKIQVIREGLINNGLQHPDHENGTEPGEFFSGLQEAEAVLSKVGGLDICALAGCYLAAAKNRKPIVIDGVISIAAALAAYRMAPCAREYMIPSHRSKEPAYQAAADAMGLQPCLELDMRLGEGTGCPVMFGIIRSACDCMNEIASFEEMQVSDAFLVDNR